MESRPTTCELTSGAGSPAPAAGLPPIQFAISEGLTDYADALRFMESRAEQIARGEAAELIWFVEHPPLYTSGTSARREDLLEPDRFPVHDAGRGGQYTYHGPGQRVAYVMIDVKRRFGDVRRFVCALERTVIRALASFNIKGEVRPGRVGVWVARPEKGDGAEDKIAAIGIRLRRWVSFHGLAINVDPDLAHFGGIVPCGIADHGVTSFEDLGRIVSIAEFDMALKAAFAAELGPLEPVAAQ